MESTQLSAPPPPKHRPGGALQGAVEAKPPRSSSSQHGEATSEHDAIDFDVPTPRRGGMIMAGTATVILLVALLLTGLIPREQNSKELNADAVSALNAPVPVNVVRPVRAPELTKLSVPGNLRPWQEVSIFARTTGYLKSFLVDISEQVKVGQLMAVIDTPEVDQQLAQARAAVLQVKAAVNKAISDRDLAQVTYNRYVKLANTNSVTQQDIDQKHSDLEVAAANLESAKANVVAAEANVERLIQLQKFEKVMAPFSGVVTGRAYDVGALILADPTTTDFQPLFKIAENDVLRVFVNVPQSAALTIRKGMEVKVTVREIPGRDFIGIVMGTTNYLDPANRSLLTEVKVVNVEGPDGRFMLLPGMYVTANFVVKQPSPPWIVPGPAIVNNADGTRVAVVNAGKIHFEKVVLGQDFGNTIEIVEGLKGDEQIVANPGERVIEGASVVARIEKPD